MKQAIANAKDRSWPQRNRERKFWYRVGGFKTCAHCESRNVFRALDPKAAGFTYYCFDCSSKDAECWPRAAGYEPRPEAVVGLSNNKLVTERELRCGPVVPGCPVRVQIFNADGKRVSLAARLQSYEPEPEVDEPEVIPPGAPEQWPSWTPQKKAWWVRSQGYWKKRAQTERVERDREASEKRVTGLADRLKKGWAR